MSSEELHIPREKLSTEARLLHYAIVSLQEELDAVDWYRQRADDSEDEFSKSDIATQYARRNGACGDADGMAAP